MTSWITLTLLYGIFVGFADIFKKKSIEKNTIVEVLAGYTLLSFVLVSFDYKIAMQLDFIYIIALLIKSFIIFISWLLALECIKNMTISTYGVLHLSSVLFSTIWAIIFLGEVLKINHFIGAIVIILGLVMVNLVNNSKDNKKSMFKYNVMLLISCFVSSFAALIDKILLRNITPYKLQFWYLLFLAIMYIIYLVLYTKTNKTNKLNKTNKINFKGMLKNYWIYLLAIGFVVGDKLLFTALSNVESKLFLVTLIKQISVIITVVVGGIVFRDRHIFYKLLCSILVILGIVITVIK